MILSRAATCRSTRSSSSSSSSSPPPPLLHQIQTRSVIHVQCAIPPHNYSVKEVSNLGTFEYRVFFQEGTEKDPISPWHDIPLNAGNSETGDRIFNYINEIPRGRVEKLEIDKKEEWNPIKQDVKKGLLRKINYYPYLWNYGAFPRTWEDPSYSTPGTSLFGDGDPIDVVEIGKFTHKIGEVVRVKVLGILALVDEGEMDWKVLAIDLRDPSAQFINGPKDLLKMKKGCIEGIRDFFINYKVPDGKPKNVLAFGGEIKDKDFALKIIDECHLNYQKIFDKKELGYSLLKKSNRVEEL